jgi:two-component sensor histidine kinase
VAEPSSKTPATAVVLKILGLIVTELVINALKHAFPGGEAGEILVSYDAGGSGWRLSVSDNGTGPGEASVERPHTGLGTSIVEALARQLDATVEKSSGPQGTTVSVVAGAAAGGS